MSKTEIENTLTAREIELLLKASDQNAFDYNDGANELSTYLQELEYDGELKFEDIKQVIFEKGRDRVKYPLKKVIKEMFTVTETNDLSRYFDETPYTSEHDLNRELLEQLLNDKGYDGILDVQEMKEWVNKQSTKNTIFGKK